MRRERRGFASSMRCIIDIALATTRVGSTLRQFFANRIRSGVITLKEAQNESQIVAIPRRVLSGSDVSDRARCCARSINPNRYGNGGKFLSVPYRFGADRAQSKKCRVGARSFCRWLELVGSDSRLQAAGLNVTSVQNPLTTLPEAVDAALRVLGRQNGPTVLAGHSFSGMIVTEAGVHPNVLALVYVAARAPDAGEDYAALAKRFPTPPASAGIVFDGVEGRLSEEAFLRDFAGDLPE